jgi:hypothetical protein
MNQVSIEPSILVCAPPVQCERSVLANKLLVTDAQQQVAASQRMLRAGQRQR